MSAVPKPRPSPKSPRRPLKKSGRIKPKKRTAGEARRIYGPKGRAEFVSDQPCSACGVHMWSVNAHVLGNDGMSRKASYKTIAPLCEKPVDMVDAHGRPLTFAGCHDLFDNYRWRFDNAFPDFNPETAAAQTEAAWQAYRGEGQ